MPSAIIGMAVAALRAGSAAGVLAMRGRGRRLDRPSARGVAASCAPPRPPGPAHGAGRRRARDRGAGRAGGLVAVPGDDATSAVGAAARGVPRAARRHRGLARRSRSRAGSATSSSRASSRAPSTSTGTRDVLRRAGREDARARGAAPPRTARPPRSSSPTATTTSAWTRSPRDRRPRAGAHADRPRRRHRRTAPRGSRSASTRSRGSSTDFEDRRRRRQPRHRALRPRRWSDKGFTVLDGEPDRGRGRAVPRRQRPAQLGADGRLHGTRSDNIAAITRPGRGARDAACEDGEVSVLATHAPRRRSRPSRRAASTSCSPATCTTRSGPTSTEGPYGTTDPAHDRLHRRCGLRVRARHQAAPRGPGDHRDLRGRRAGRPAGRLVQPGGASTSATTRPCPSRPPPTERTTPLRGARSVAASTLFPRIAAETGG